MQEDSDAFIDSLTPTHTITCSDQWPSTPPEYEIEFSDGCVPPNLHNSSDCPSNFPTLDTLPRDKRPADYSEAYDGDQADGKASGGLMISPAVMSLMGANPKQGGQRKNVSGLSFCSAKCHSECCSGLL